ncbi:hypothetical protein HBN70_06615 [Pseudomonas lundensis]|uniref:hypothetical protein n=1 Tax=Pseudomonas lundensis TaxID=86185 RepID=UPI001473D5AB|nr:hypothetical protein [Pseudomonas lundensis]NNA20437.1 hypothetical protein [Pseudomonas lundensis]
MNDSRDLKAIAEACQQHQPLRFMRSHGALYIRNDNGIVFDVHQNRSFPEFMAQNKDYADLALAANPETILALIAENKELGRYLCTCRDCGGEGALHTGDWHSYGHMEPPEPVMEKCGECDGTGLLGEVQDLYQVITERDQLCAEVAGLKTGYEAYEQVNAGLKAEVEWLRDDLEQKEYDANAWRNGEESVWIEVFNSDGDDPFISAISGQITVEQLALIQAEILEYRDDYFEKGSGLYVFRCAHYQAHYDNVGMTEPAHWETDFESYSAFPWKEEAAAMAKGEQS